MKKNIILIIIILFLFISGTSNSVKFKFIINKENIICYNENIDKKEIEEYRNFYTDVVNNFYIKNNLTQKKIENEKILIILCIDNYNEWINADESRKKIKKTLNYDKYIDILEKNIILKDDNNNSNAVYIYDSILPSIIIRNKNNKFNKYFLLISEYNHHLIKINLINNQTNEYFEFNKDFFILHYLFDEGFTNYLSTYLYIFKGKNLGNFLYDNNVKLETEKAKIIYEYLKKKLIKNNNEFKFYYADLYNFKKDTFKIIDLEKNFSYLILFMSYINYFYSSEKLYELMHFLYNKYYENIEEIFEKIFNIKAKKFFENLDKELYS
ncbi:MAG: hypothetical protein NUV32_10360 [Exilispira sp.]|jgi:hypothetical protein|nr:hypothetical protein [Exilispira sp.]